MGPPVPFPVLSPETEVFERPKGPIDPHSAYARAIRQYATSSAPDAAQMQPACVIYPATEQDIVAIIRYARAAGISIAVRSGGHAYHGGSSTGGDDIQLDVVRDSARPLPGAPVVSNSFGFGGHNATLVFGPGN